MKYATGLSISLSAVWWLWSGHPEPFLLGLGACSVLLVVLICARMGILDAETVPLRLGIRPFTVYLPWLLKEIAIANLDVARIILARQMPIRPTLVTVRSRAQTDLGHAILANSITLTPGTVAVSVEGDRILVHALSLSEARQEAEMSIEMNRRVRDLEARS